MTSKYPPAKPGALRLLAPQRGLFAIVKNKNRRSPHSRGFTTPRLGLVRAHGQLAAPKQSSGIVKRQESPSRAGGLLMLN